MKKTIGIVITLLVVLMAARSYLKGKRISHASTSTFDEGNAPGSVSAKSDYRLRAGDVRSANAGSASAVESSVRTAKVFSKQNSEGLEKLRKILHEQRIKNSLTKTMNKVYDKMGHDRTAELAVLLLLRSINESSKRDVPANLKLLCRTQDTCPLPMAEFYDSALERLNPKELGNVKVLLQKSMLDSDMPITQKQSILLNELVSAEFRDDDPLSYKTSDNRLHLSQSSMALVLTQEQFFSLKPNPQTAITASLTAIRNTQDKAAQLLLIKSLARNYPQYGAYYNPQLETLGLIGRSPAQSSR